MSALFRRIEFFVIALIVLGGTIPLVAYAATYGGVPMITPQNAIPRLIKPDRNVVLIDIRTLEQFQRQHVTGAHSWPFEQIQAISSADQLPVAWQGRELFILCSVGYESANLARHLKAIGITEVYSIRGGMQEYIAALSEYPYPQQADYLSITGEPSFQSMSLFEQWSAILAGFVFKPTYMILSLLMAVALWKSRKPELAALKYSMLAFFIGEAWCAVNYLIFNHTSLLSEYLHSYGMVVAFGLAIFAISDGMDSHVIKLSARGQRCSALELCGRCIKTEDVDCGIRKVLMLLIPAIGALAFIPLLASFSTVSYNTLIVDTLYNYNHLFNYQVFENRYCPILALVLFTAAFVILWQQSHRPISIIVRILAAGGLGAIGFSFFRLVFGKVYVDNLIWATYWEELTELIFLMATWAILLLFRHALLTDVAGYWPWLWLNRVVDLPVSPPLPTSKSVISNNHRVILIACKIFQDQLGESLPPGLVKETYFLEFGLHRYPVRLRQKIQTFIDDLKEPSLVVLGYGLCGNGLHGINSRQHTLLIPRVDDCIPILLGSYNAYLQQTQVEPATFYLSQGWLESGSHPLNEYEEYVQRFGPIEADMIINAQYQHCKRLAFVANNKSTLEAYREEAQKVAQFCQRWGTHYQEILGSDAYIQRLVAAIQEPERAQDDFLIITPGAKIHSQEFLRMV